MEMSCSTPVSQQPGLVVEAGVVPEQISQISIPKSFTRPTELRLWVDIDPGHTDSKRSLIVKKRSPLVGGERAGINASVIFVRHLAQDNDSSKVSITARGAEFGEGSAGRWDRQELVWNSVRGQTRGC